MDRKEYPASITKIMTALVAIESGKLDSKIQFSENAVYNLEEGSSHVGIQVGEVLSMRRALYGLMLESAKPLILPPTVSAIPFATSFADSSISP